MGMLGALLNALELAIETTPPDEAGVIRVTLAVAEESIQQAGGAVTTRKGMFTLTRSAPLSTGCI